MNVKDKFISDEEMDAALDSDDVYRQDAAILLYAADLQWQEHQLLMFSEGAETTKMLRDIATGKLKVVTA